MVLTIWIFLAMSRHLQGNLAGDIGDALFASLSLVLEQLLGELDGDILAASHLAIAS